MALKPGDSAPEFTLAASTGESISLNDLAGKKVVLYFYPRDNTPGCTREACGFRDVHDDIRQAGALVFGVSKDSLVSHEKFVGKYSLNFPLLSDEDTSVATAFGAWGEKKMYGRTVMGMKRMTFLIDEQGVVQEVWPAVKPDGHAEEVLGAIRGG